VIILENSRLILNELLKDIFNQILSIQGEALRKQGVTISMNEVHILEAIKEEEKPFMGNIAKKLRITIGTLSVAISVLEKKGYVKKEVDVNDKRRILLKVTKKAYPVLNLHEKFHDEMVENVIKDLNIDQNHTLIKSLSELSNYFKRKY
jgi:DNA-binding MarR family transcriptional regulator